MTNDYERLSQNDIFDLPLNAASGTSRAMLSNRLSWFFNLTGPSLTLDTACSSSLYALHLACQSIRLGESTQALVTGANLILHPNLTSQLSAMHMVSPDGISHSFDDQANGYGRGEAVAAILVKPLLQALEDGDTIRCVIRGTGANQDGKTPGITMPSGHAQSQLIKATYQTAGLPLSETSYFEAHGTGTKIGDPTELEAIGSAFGASRPKDKPLYVGSVKTNVGHTEGTAGLAAIIKTTLALEHATLPGLVGFEKLNPKLLLEKWGLALPIRTMPWPHKGLRRASVNSFGFGGANAHAILDDAHHYLSSRGLYGSHNSVVDANSPPQGAAYDNASESPKLLPFSTQDQDGIDRLSKQLEAYLTNSSVSGQRSAFDVNHLAYTLTCRRTQFSIRSFAVGRSTDDIASSVKTLTARRQKKTGNSKNMIFVFTGQGAQWQRMGHELLAYPAFAQSVDRSQQYLDEFGCDWDAREVLQDPGPRINIAKHSQPMCTILQLALVDLLASWGVRPGATVGHSSGEIAAAYAAGGITHKDAVKIGYMRGKFCSIIQPRLGLRKGAMLAAGLTPQGAQEYLDLVPSGSVVIGCINSPNSMTLSGDESEINFLEDRIKSDGKFARKLRVELAYHSSHMQIIAEDFQNSLGELETSIDFTCPMFSSVTSHLLDDPTMLEASYWCTNLVSTVRFSDAVKNLLTHFTMGPRNKMIPTNWFAALELGPHEALKGPFSQCAAALKGKRSVVPYASMLRRGESGIQTALEAAGLLWSLGHSIDLMSVNFPGPWSGEEALKALSALPPYPWQHRKGFWHEPRAAAAQRLRKFPRTDLLGVPVDDENPFELRWGNVLRSSEAPWMRDHAITGTVLFPAAGMLIMALEAALQVSTTKQQAVHALEFHDVRFENGLVIPDTDDAVETSLSLRPHESLAGWFHWNIYSRQPAMTWVKNCSGLLGLIFDAGVVQSKDNDSQAALAKAKFHRIKARASQPVDMASFYERLESVGLEYGPTFRSLTSASVVEGEATAFGTLRIPDTRSTLPHQHEYPHTIHPATLDTMLHLIFVALSEGRPIIESSIPISVEKIVIAMNLPTSSGVELFGHATSRAIDARDASGDVTFSDSDWSSPKVSVSHMVFRNVSSSVNSTAQSTRGIAEAPKRAAHLCWLPDLDLLGLARANMLVDCPSKGDCAPDEVSVNTQISTWLDLECHKRSSLRIKAIVDTEQAAETMIQLACKYAHTQGGADFVISTSRDDAFAHLSSQTRTFREMAAFKAQRSPPSVSVGKEQSFDILIRCLDRADATHDRLDTEALSSLTANGHVLVVGPGISDENGMEADDALTPAAEGLLTQHGFGNVLARVANPTGTFFAARRPYDRQMTQETSKTVYVVEPAERSDSVDALIERLRTTLADHKIALEVRQLDDMGGVAGQMVISLLEVEQAWVMHWTAEQFDQFRLCFLSQSYVLWLTGGSTSMRNEEELAFAPTTGLLRTVRSELPQLKLPHLDLSGEIDLGGATAAAAIMQVFNATTTPRGPDSQNIETEFSAGADGTLWIPRVVSNVDVDFAINAHADLPTPVAANLSAQYGRALKLVGGRAGSGPCWVDDFALIDWINDDSIEVRTTCLSLQTLDMSSEQGPTSQVAAGIVTRVGADVEKFATGDRVFFPRAGAKGLSTRLRARQDTVSKIPDNMSADHVLRFTTAYMVAHHTLHHVASTAAGEYVLIHLRDLDIALAALLAAREKCAKVFITVSSSKDREALMRQRNVDGERVFDASSTDLSRRLLESTKDRGFDVILNDHTGVSRRQVSLCVAESGRFIDISGKVQLNDMRLDVSHNNVSFCTVDLRGLKRSSVEDLFATAANMLERTKAGTHMIFAQQALSVADLTRSTAFEIQGNGSLLLHFSEEASVPVVPIKPALPALDPESVYILAGGLGALGLSIASNMVEYGARHIMLLSRSGITTDRQRKMVDDLVCRGCSVSTPICDVTNETQVKAAMREIEDTGQCAKGLIQCATVLQVTSLPPGLSGAIHS